MLNNQLRMVQESWEEYYRDTLDELKIKIEENDNSWIYEAINDINSKMFSNEDILYECDELEAKLNKAADEGSDEELQELKRQAEQHLLELRKTINRKSVLYAELLSNSRILIEINEQIIENEKEKMMLVEEISVNTVEVEMKSQIVDELKERLAENKRIYKALKRDIKLMDVHAEALKQQLKEKEDEIDINDELLRQKEMEIALLEKITGLKAPLDGQVEEAPKKTAYRAIKGDLVDELLARILNESNCTLPVRRLGKGNYMFGTKKIYCKVTASNLLVRVGGGYSSFKEYLIQYGDAEADRIQDAM